MSAILENPKAAVAECFDVGDLAAMLKCSKRHVYRLTDGGKMPRPIRLGSLVRWRKMEILQWIAAGCPAVREMKKGGA